MALTLVLGPANSAKAGQVLGAYAAQAARGALLVVPTAGDARHYRRELMNRSRPPLVLGAVLTFGALASEIARRADYGARRLTERQRERVLARVLAGAELPSLRASAPAPGFRTAAGALIAELERELVDVARFRAALRAWAAQDVRRAPYARDLGRIYADYAAELGRSERVDGELYAWRAVDALRAAPAAWGSDPVLFYGFDDLTGVQRDAVQTLAGQAGAAVTVSLTYEPGREALAARAETVEELRPLATEVISLEPQDDHYADGSRVVLHHLERHLFEAGAPALAPPDGPGRHAVTLLEAGGERAEAELVAAEILALTRDGVEAEEIAVLYRSPSPLIGRVLAEYGIRVASAAAVAFAQTTLGRSVLAAARCAWRADEASAEELLAFLRAPGLVDDLDPVDAVDALARRRAIAGARELRAAIDGGGGSFAESLAGPVGLLDALAAAGTDETPGAAGAGLCALGRTLLAAPHRGRASALYGDEALDASALAALVGAVGELSALEPEPSAVELLELLSELAVDVENRDEAGAVLVSDPISVRARRFRVVFVCGLQEGEFPRAGRVEPFLSDERRRELAAASGLVLRVREDALAAERYLFYAAVSRATERVYLAYRSSDEEGNLALPSPFIADVAELLWPGWADARRRRLLADVVWAPEQAPTAVERERGEAARFAPATGEPPAPARVLGPQALARMRHTRVVSAGALERYGDCPVRWLVESQLAPRRLAPDEEPLVRGSLIHGLLERLLATLGGPVTEQTLPRALEILDGLTAELARSARGLGAGEPPVVRAGALRAIEAGLRRYLEHEARTSNGWTPVALERRFGFEDSEPDSLPPLALGAGPEPVLVRGAIDRIDVDADGHALVRDYKSGSPRQDWPAARWKPDRRLQVALYMLVARELERLDVVAGVYQPLRGDDLRARGIYADEVGDGAGGFHASDMRSREELELELDDAARRAVELAARLRAGDVEPCPATCSRDGCAYPAICRSQ
ncbi:MAG TPA: PD-(D/E)XK nuclease family protein [Solirubrobacteraceae bacterium]|nr:PD-(D/E)XK nuclease family protein [Solirubrobacteraceae bacterium]